MKLNVKTQIWQAVDLGNLVVVTVAMKMMSSWLVQMNLMKVKFWPTTVWKLLTELVFPTADSVVSYVDLTICILMQCRLNYAEHSVQLIIWNILASKSDINAFVEKNFGHSTSSLLLNVMWRVWVIQEICVAPQIEWISTTQSHKNKFTMKNFKSYPKIKFLWS